MHPQDRLNVTLEAQEWNAVMAVLGTAPYRDVANLIGQIQAQCQAQDARNRSAQQVAMNGPVPNGLASGQPGPFPRVVEPESDLSA